ncbi:4-hydroxythreonine-4-phosphate dehydrogenase PdxA [Halomonas urumqiensis]|uniref:4-hydroxythreonine-4-phosphate dehydrogenase PdxA n=1 Tax=Halomonas urumqiensis TaxID=1684789 RepID=A0A2N7UQ64_9GAMM|nr:4-hydroxythreonine-4-phosphate dehydrogenase PdxA [Halomonas urumqiensis]PMR82568.1 4-hydroxythreonine-4-phosphate dehydrogenase PdxA [Halomonas urumqiensis]PTB01025.1 4-hydroxythreonine-4-phosphate dehydrogenase PdxA [Halomonas urumqiensis]GHE22902.1 4-hydroxythreonine-4-phosphate dehydrogenase [Halomonas urumqiensis]
MNASTRTFDIAITMGDPAGIGPEIICRALVAMSAEERASSLVVGDPAIFRRAAATLDAKLNFVPLDQASEGDDSVAVAVVEVPKGVEIPDGRISAAAGDMSFRCVKAAVDLVQSGRARVIVTAPLNKAALHEAGHHYDGHTGMLASLTGAPSSFMLLASETLSTLHVSTHVSLSGAIERVSKERITETVEAGHAHLLAMGIESPRIAVAGLNPHCGEGGIFGDEDTRIIAPAVEALKARGFAVSGPISADTVFYRASRGEFDLVVAQYHDQGHIPVKLIAFDTTVNVSLGLPIQRTSVDHGTAFDIAWQGRADATNMGSAIAYARRLAAGAGE